MGRKKIVILKEVLSDLYHSKRYSPARIGRIYNCDGVTVRSRLKELHIPLRTPSQARTRYKRVDFDGSDDEKAYIIGFRTGDLNVYVPRGASETVIVRCHTTVKVQNDLFVKLFEKYGKVTVSVAQNGRNMNANCYLNKSFSFLLPKYNDTTRVWLSKDDLRMRAFVAGYIDAEGSFRMNQGKARFKIDSYDIEVLRDTNIFLNALKITTKFRPIGRRGDSNGQGGLWKHDLWRLTINEASSLEKCIRELLPYLRHKNRIHDAKESLRNIKQRRHNGTIK